MEKLSIEEKAKRYDEAIERARDVYTYYCDDREQLRKIESIFPELKESEGERVRNKLIEFFKGYSPDEEWWGNITQEDILAWIEKQGKQSKWKPSKDEMDALYGLAYITNKMDDKKDEAITKLYQDLKREFFNGVSYENMFPSSPVNSNINIKKQGEQKPADKAEPKFHEGEWVVFNGKHKSVYQIEKIENFQYTLRHILGGSMPLSFSHEDMIRVWTVKDAKDGDVLVCPKYAGDIIPNIFIFKDIKIKDNDVFCYCSFLEKFRTESYVANADPINTDFYPATKKQRDLLFKKMHEEGYEWDADKLELKKVEQKAAENKELTEFDKAVGVSIGTWNPKTPAQIQSVKAVSKRLLKLAKKQINDEHTPAWSEEDKTGLTNTIIMLKEGASLHFNKKDITKAVDWLKSIEDRVQPQPKREWSEEDYNEIETIACHLDNTDNEGMAEVLRSIRDKYCHVIPQNTWRPSDEQMQVLSNAGNFFRPFEKNHKVLWSLYNDLKKLREE